MAWYDNAQTWLTAAGGLLAAAAGWGLRTWKGWSATSTQVVQDKVEAAWYEDMLNSQKVDRAERDAALASARTLLDQRIEDARMIARLETQLEAARERSAHCELATAKAETRAAEAEEQRRALSEQLLFSHMRSRKMYAVISKLDPVEAANVVKDVMDSNVEDVSQSIKAQDAIKGAASP